MANISITFLSLLANMSQSHLSDLKTNFALNQLVMLENQKQNIYTIACIGKAEYLHLCSQYVADEMPKLIFSKNSFNITLHEELGFNNNIMYIAIAALEDERILEFTNRIFEAVQVFVKGVFVVPRNMPAPSLKEIKQHFKSYWHKGLIKTFIITHNSAGMEFYTYYRFPNFEIKQYDRLPQSFFMPHFRNMHGYHVRVPLQYEPPRVFTIVNKNNSTELVGYGAAMLKAFLEEHNGRAELFYPKQNNSFGIQSTVEQLRRGDINISTSTYVDTFAGIRMTYPLRMMKWQVLVPHTGKIDAYLYFLRPFRFEIWQLTIAVFLSLSLLRYYMQRKRVARNQRDTGRAFLEVYRLILSIPTPMAKYFQRFSFRYLLFFVNAFALSFILTNSYTAILTSFLSKLIMKDQIDTIAQLVAQNISVHAVDYDIPVILRNKGLPRDFDKILISRIAPELTKEIVDLFPLQAFIAREDMTRFVLTQQAYLNLPLLHVVKETISTVPVGFLMLNNAPFLDIQDNFILRCIDSGLVDKWMQWTILDGFKGGVLIKRTEQKNAHAPLTLHHFQFSWFLITFGNITASICFLLEHIRYKLQRKYRIIVVKIK